MVTISQRGAPQLRRRQRSKLAHGQCVILVFLAAIFGAYILFMLEMTSDPPTTPNDMRAAAPKIPPMPDEPPQEDDFHDTLWAKQAEEELKEQAEEELKEQAEEELKERVKELIRVERQRKKGEHLEKAADPTPRTQVDPRPQLGDKVGFRHANNTKDHEPTRKSVAVDSNPIQNNTSHAINKTAVDSKSDRRNKADAIPGKDGKADSKSVINKTAVDSKPVRRNKADDNPVKDVKADSKSVRDKRANVKPDTQRADNVLRAYLELIDQEEWKKMPLPNRTATAQASHLTLKEYPKLKSCKRFAAQFPIDNYPDADPFLPWIHDVFPEHNGKFIQIVAQNKRRCRTGTTNAEKEILARMQPQAAIFQHVPVKRLKIDGKTRYQLTSHEDADPDGMTTRFICRFKPSMEETLSVFNVNYDYAAWRKAHHHTFSEEGHDIKSIYTSQLLFKCPVPEGLQEIVRTGKSVRDDFATIFLDIIPIRTPVRYGASNQFFPPWYRNHEDKKAPFNTTKQWGTHILPSIEDSGRWENIPICAPSLMTYKPAGGDPAAGAEDPISHEPKQVNKLVVCTWTSAGYHTRGQRYQVTDGARRLREWVHFNLMVGVQHFYVYDNSGAHNRDASLQPIADMFPDHITLVDWPATVCNNNPNNVDSPGERSSQYAAEASCRLRFGPYTQWMGGYDVDEYITPMGNYVSLLQIIDQLDKEGMKMINFRSWRAWPRRALIEEPVPIGDRRLCKHRKRCFELKVPPNRTVLQTYNCDRQKGTKTQQMPAEKQIYRPDYVLLHFVHYSTVTVLSAANHSEYDKMTTRKWHWPMTKDDNLRFSDEINEASMLHAKAMARPDTAAWEDNCKNNSGRICRIGNPFPEGAEENNVTKDAEGWTYNCYVNERLEKYYVPRLEEAMKSTEQQYAEIASKV